MRKIYSILILSPILFGALSCDRDDQLEIFPEEYFKVLYVKDSGIRDIAMNTAQDEVEAQMLVVKGGAHPEMSADCRFEVMPLPDAASLWSLAEERLAIIPEGSYRLPDSVLLTEEQPHLNIGVELYPLKMAPAMREKPELEWILPLRLASDSGEVSEFNSTVLLRCSVVSPLIDWQSAGDQSVIIDYKTLDYPVPVVISKTEINKAQVKGKIEALSEQVVSDYNALHGTSYLQMPASSYSLGDLSIDAGSLEGSATLSLTRSGLTADEKYLLPVRFVSVSSDLFDLSEEVKYFIIENPKYAYAEVDPAGWKIAFCNSEDRNSDYWAVNMLNRNPQSNFCSYWNVNQQTRIGADTDDFRYPSEGSYPGTCTYTSGRMAGETIVVPYPCCDGVRRFSDVVVVIDFGETINIHSIGLTKMAGNISNLDLKGVEFYTEDQFTLETAAQYKGTDNEKYRAAIANYTTANAGNAWRPLMQWNDIPRGDVDNGLPLIWNPVKTDIMNSSASRGRFLKIHPTASYRTSYCIEICDLHVRKLITIDGEPAI